MRNRIKSLLLYVITIAVWCLVIWVMSGCSASWHLRKAKKKAPGLFDTTTVVTRAKINLPTVDFQFECPQLGMAPITLYSPIIDTINGIIYLDSVRIELQAVDSSMIKAEVHCPDPEIIIKTQTNTVYIEPTFWDKVKMTAGWVAGIMLIAFIGLIVFNVFLK